MTLLWCCHWARVNHLSVRSEPKDNEYLEEARCRHDEFTRVPWAPPTEERVAAVAQLCAIISWISLLLKLESRYQRKLSQLMQYARILGDSAEVSADYSL